MAKKNELVVKKVKKDIRQKILVEEGGKMNSDIPYKIIHSEYVPSVEKAKERIAELKIEYPDKSFCYFSV